MMEPNKVLTIGGWDPCGAFGMPADMKTFAALNCHGMGVMTVVTAQNSQGWYGAEFMSADFVAQQLDAVLSDYGAESIKTGFLGRVDLIEVIAAKIQEHQIENIVIDPVVVNARGKAMFPQEVIDAYFQLLFPIATVITPNLREFNLLMSNQTDPWKMTERSLEAAYEFVSRFQHNGKPPAFVVKGILTIDQDGSEIISDGLIAHGAIELFSHSRIDTQNVSGTGDSFSAALCCQLACGHRLAEAVAAASQLTHQAIKHGADWQLSSAAGPINHFAIGDS